MLPTSVDSSREPVGISRTLRVWFAKRGAKAAAWALLLLFCVYRLATFIPQPLDGPHTLRPILNTWFDAFLRSHQSPEAAYENWRTLCLFALLVAPALAVLNFVRENGTLRLPPVAGKILCSRGLFFGAMA